MRATIFFFLLLFCSCYFLASAQSSSVSILTEKQTLITIRESVTNSYNYNFSEARKHIALLEPEFKTHPVVYMLQAVNISIEHYPLKSNAKAAEAYKYNLERCISFANKMLTEDKLNMEALFFSTMATLMKAQFLSVQGQTFSAFTTAKDAYDLILKNMEYKDRYPELMFTSGLYNYFREYMPEANPNYRPLLIFFKPGNKEEGFKQLDFAARNSAFCRPDALHFLTRISFINEANHIKALPYARALLKDYKGNPYYCALAAEVFYKNNSLKEMETAIDFLELKAVPRFELWGKGLRLLLQEAKDNNPKRMLVAYESLFKLTQGKGREGQKSAASLAAAGVARAYKALNDIPNAKKWYGIAKNSSSYAYWKLEAEAFLN